MGLVAVSAVEMGRNDQTVLDIRGGYQECFTCSCQVRSSFRHQ